MSVPLKAGFGGTEWRDLTCPAGQAALRLWSAPGAPFTPARVQVPDSSSQNETAALLGGRFVLVGVAGLDLRCGGGLLAALERPRRSIHSRSGSSPCFNIAKQNSRPFGRPFRFGRSGGT